MAAQARVFVHNPPPATKTMAPRLPDRIPKNGKKPGNTAPRKELQLLKEE